jgi:sec-independent protein translocase protein TatA
MPTLGGPELIFILLIVLIVFGAGKLKDVGRDLGKGIKEFRSAMTEPENADPKDQQHPTKT